MIHWLFCLYPFLFQTCRANSFPEKGGKTLNYSRTQSTETFEATENDMYKLLERSRSCTTSKNQVWLIEYLVDIDLYTNAQKAIPLESETKSLNV